MESTLQRFLSLPVIALSVITIGCNSSPTTSNKEQNTAAGDEAAVIETESPEVNEISDSGISDPQLRQRYNQAVGRMGQFQYTQAYEEFAELQRKYPNNVDLAVDTAIARLNMAGDGDLEEALQILKQTLRKFPDHTRANYCVGLIESYMGPPANPTPYLRVAALGAPDDPDAAYLLAKSLEQEEQLDEAKQVYLRSLELNPYYASSLLGLARIARMSGDLSEATRLIEQFEGLKANPNGRVFEFAYKRMGRLGEVGGSTGTTPEAKLPAGNLFDQPLRCEDLESITSLVSESVTIELAVADIDQDAHPDLVIVTDKGLACLLDLGDRRQVASVEQLPWLETKSVTAVALGDVDHNGQLDVFLARDGDNQLWYQKGDSWELSNDPAIAGGSCQTVACRLYDSDHDGDLDMVCVNRDAPLQMINNDRDGTFRLLQLDDSITGSSTGYQQVVLGDFDNHRDTDIFLAGPNRESAVIWNERLWNHRLANDLPSPLSKAGVRSTLCRDINHDGHLELVVRRESSADVWSRRIKTGWEKVAEVSMPANGLNQFAIVDLNGDGQLQLLSDSGSEFIATECAGSSEPVVALASDRSIAGWTLVPLQPNKGYSLVFFDSSGTLNIAHPGPGRFAFAAVQFAGAENTGESMRSNFSGIGTRWKAQIGAGWTTGQVFPAVSGSSQSLIPEIIGLQGQEQIDFIAVDWTDGVFQAELAIEPSSVKMINETQRQLASCPIIFAWNGQRIEFVTDVLGVGGIGFLTAPHQYAPSRPWEHLMLSNEQLQPKDDRLIVKLGEPMEEACYLQSAQLHAVHLPQGWNFVVDERLGASEPMPTGETRFYRNEWPVASACSSIQQDCLGELSVADGVAPDLGALDSRFIGLVKNEFLLEFSFESLAFDDNSSTQYGLLIDGWVEYPYSQVVFAAWQANRAYQPPSLEFQAEDGTWNSAWQHFGYPAGMPRRMLLPLPQAVKPNHRLRIRSEIQVYWDRISLVQLEDCPAAEICELSLEKAELKRSGFAKRSTHAQFRPYYDYSQRTGTWDARHHPGFYTRLGEVTELLRRPSLHQPLVVFGPGEEVHFEFAASPLEDRKNASVALAGYVLSLKGWCKDLDLYTNQGNTLGPMPGESSTSKTLELKYNSRYESGPWYPYAGN